MCGRYNVTPDAEAFIAAFGITEGITGLPSEPLYNVCPSGKQFETRAPTVRRTKSGGRGLVMSRWPLTPFWAKQRDPPFNTANAKGETIEQKAAFRGPWRRGQRCLVPANGYYEWQAVPGGKTKRPYHIRLPDGGLMAFGGVWDRWRGTSGDEFESFAIITTEPNDEMRAIHSRMPLIIAPADYEGWLDLPPVQALRLVHPCPDGVLTWRAVSTHVNNPRNNDPECLRPLEDADGAV